MNARLFALTLALSLTAVAPLAMRGGALAAPLENSELKALCAADNGSLDELRAGLLESPAPIEAAERDALEQAAVSDSGLEDLRGGELHLTDREIKLMLIAGAVVLLVALLV